MLYNCKTTTYDTGRKSAVNEKCAKGASLARTLART
jgi:hypothetical protein